MTMEEVLSASIRKEVLPLLMEISQRLEKLEFAVKNNESRSDDDLIDRRMIAEIRHCSIRTVDRLVHGIEHRKCPDSGTRLWSRNQLIEAKII